MSPDLLLMAFSAVYVAVTVAAVCYGFMASHPPPAAIVFTHFPSR